MSGSAGGGPVGTPRGGARRAAKPKPRLRPEVLGLVLGGLVALAVWGLLVWLAIHSGRSARGGDSGKWAILAVASLGAVVSLFACLWLVTLVLRKVGILEDTRRSEQSHRH